MKSFAELARAVARPGRIRPGLVAFVCLFALFLATSPARAQTNSDADLTLTDQPRAETTSLPPNLLVAIDDSGSMDFETLFPTNSGLLYYNNGFWRNGGYVSDTGTAYGYIFPNGFNNCGSNGCQYRDRRIYGPDRNGNIAFNAVPPIPSTAFARSPQYNAAYFDPATAYPPWPRVGNVNPAHAYYDPAVQQTWLDLTSQRESNADGEQFLLQEGMVVPAGTRYYHANGKYEYRYYCVHYNNNNQIDDYYQASDSEISRNRCKRSGYQLGQYSVRTGDPGFYAEDSDGRAQGELSLGISYFPATFYLNKSTALPSGYRYYNGPTLTGMGPNGQTLVGYEIRPENFADNNAGRAAYNTAIQNFANWFTFYRKRSLAIRGSAARAFDAISNVRVHACTISNADSCLASNNAGSQQGMTTLSRDDNDDDSSDAQKVRDAFYVGIYTMDFSQARATPNRPALNALGQAFETDKTIVQSACQRNYALLFTDGFNTEKVSGIGNVDKNRGRGPNSPIPDNYSNTIADIAMRYYANFNPPSGISDAAVLPLPAGCPGDESLDCEARPHVSFFGITLGVRGIIFGNTTVFGAENRDPYSHPPPWYLSSASPNRAIATGDLPVDGAWEIDDLWHAALDSRGALINAASPQAIATSFGSVLSQILGRGETLSNAAGNGTTYDSRAAIYQTRYQPAHWTGDLLAYAATQTDNPDAQPLWQAADQLPGYTGSRANDSRQIITALPGNGGQLAGVAFEPEVSALVSQDHGLNADSIVYLRGDRSLEQQNAPAGSDTVFRDRGDTVLGDIINAVPVYVGSPDPLAYAGRWADRLHPNTAPAPPENQGQPYYDIGNAASFVAEYKNRTPIVYVGANDGMLHGFDAATGEEHFAYIPNAVLDGLAGGDNPLTSPSYLHRAFVDGQSVAGPVFEDGRWQTLLVGGLRNGGRRIYALDITDPDNLDEAHAADIMQWEFSDPELGYTFGKPVLVRLHNGRWAAIFGNGYNSDSHGAALFVVDAQTGALIARLDTGARPADGAKGNGLATPTPVDIDGDRIVDYVYAGDLYGNVWRFDLSAVSPAGWDVSRLFQAESDSRAQPITTAPAVAVHPYGEKFGVMVYVGTGQNIAVHTNDDDPPNSVYGLWDTAVASYAPGSAGPTPPPAEPIPRSRLVTQNLSDLGALADTGLTLRGVTDNAVDYIENASSGPQIRDRGWAIDFDPDSDEAVVDAPQVVGNNLEFASVVLNPGTCTLTSSGFYTIVDRTDGGPPAENVYDFNGDGVVDEQDTAIIKGQLGDDQTGNDPVVAGVGFGDRGSPGPGPSFRDPITGVRVLKLPLTNGGTTVTLTVASDGHAGRRSWHEIRE